MIGPEEARDLVIVLDSGIGEIGTTERLARSLVVAYENLNVSQRERGAIEEAYQKLLGEINELKASLASMTADRDMWQEIAAEACAPIKAALSDSAYPRTLCEKCTGDEVSGCICGMVVQDRRGCPVCLIRNDDDTCDCASFCADCATLEGKAANDPDTCYPGACAKHGGA